MRYLCVDNDAAMFSTRVHFLSYARVVRETASERELDQMFPIFSEVTTQVLHWPWTGRGMILERFFLFCDGMVLHVVVVCVRFVEANGSVLKTQSMHSIGFPRLRMQKDKSMRSNGQSEFVVRMERERN